MDKAKLEYYMALKGISRLQLCAMLNISYTAFHRKCTGKSEFTRKEIRDILRILELSSPMDIFFTDLIA